MDSHRFHKIKSLSDIKLEKERLRYEQLLAENKLAENIQSVKQMASITSLFGSITSGFEFAHDIFRKIADIIALFRGPSKKKKKKKNIKTQQETEHQ